MLSLPSPEVCNSTPKSTRNHCIPRATSMLSFAALISYPSCYTYPLIKQTTLVFYDALMHSKGFRKPYCLAFSRCLATQRLESLWRRLCGIVWVTRVTNACTTYLLDDLPRLPSPDSRFDGSPATATAAVCTRTTSTHTDKSDTSCGLS